MFKKLLFVSFIAVSLLTSCEEPVHEEYDLYGENTDNGNNNGGSNNGGNNTNTGTWFPLALNNEWNMSGTDVTGAAISQSMKFESTEVIDSHTFYKVFQTETTTSGTTTSYSHIRWDGNILESRGTAQAGDLTDLEDLGITISPMYIHPLKQDMTLNQTWSENVTLSIDFFGFLYSVIYTFNYTYSEHFDTYTVNSVVYNDVAKVKMITSYIDPFTSEAFEMVQYSYYAKNIGPIKTALVEDNVETGVLHLTSYELN